MQSLPWENRSLIPTLKKLSTRRMLTFRTPRDSQPRDTHLENRYAYIRMELPCEACHRIMYVL